LTLLNNEAKLKGEKKRVFLPTWAADIVFFDHLEIERGKYSNFKQDQMRSYDLVATAEGNFAFTEFATHRDSMFASLKILQMIVDQKVKLSDIIRSLPKYFYRTTQVECTQELKGKMMRKFLENSKGKKSSTLDGVKIWLDEHDWILMIPDQYSDHLNLYVQAESEDSGEAIIQAYTAKIEEWSQA
jgi:mannose-1-phosphate guanylyltransferase/phosphomannomutase